MKFCYQVSLLWKFILFQLLIWMKNKENHEGSILQIWKPESCPGCWNLLSLSVLTWRQTKLGLVWTCMYVSGLRCSIVLPIFTAVRASVLRIWVLVDIWAAWAWISTCKCSRWGWSLHHWAFINVLEKKKAPWFCAANKIINIINRINRCMPVCKAGTELEGIFSLFPFFFPLSVSTRQAAIVCPLLPSF